MRVVRQHHMTRSDAKDWIESRLQGLLSQFGSSVSGATYSWRGDIMDFSFAASLAGRFNGTIEVTDTDFMMNVPLGFFQRMFEGRAQAAIERWLDENLP